MRADRDAVTQIKASVSPVQAIERYTGQQAQHSKYVCPFHSDKHPSLSVKGNHWRCWSCNEHGDVIDFTTKYFRISFREAINKLADDFSVPIQREPDPVQDPLEKLCEAIRRESNEEIRNELRQYRSEIDSEIDNLTAVHRALMHSGAPRETLSRYAAEIDDLIAYRERI